MLTKVEAQDAFGTTLSLPLQDVSSGYTVKNIDGLDPVKATIVSAGFAQLDGSQFQSARRENRNITLTLGIEPYSGGATVRSLRAALYAYFMPKSVVTLKFYDDGNVDPTAIITGTVESCETPLFSKDPEMAVSFICFDPSFFAPTETHLTGATVSPSGGTETLIEYPGTIEAGFRLVVHVDRSIAGFTVYNRRGSSTNQMDVTLPLVNTDEVELSTVMRNKYITKNGNSVLYALTAGQRLGPFYPGNNYFKVTVSGAAIDYDLYYTTKYGGL